MGQPAQTRKNNYLENTGSMVAGTQTEKFFASSFLVPKDKEVNCRRLASESHRRIKKMVIFLYAVITVPNKIIQILKQLYVEINFLARE